MYNKKKTGILILAGVMACCLGTEAFGAVYRDDTALTYSSRYGTGNQDTGEENYSSGPGVRPAAAEEAETVSGPKVRDVTMSESYHEEFQLYEQSINGQYFLYSNVANGGLTDEPVFVDIPANLVYTVEKDGVPISYTSRQKLNEKGTYVMRFTAVYDDTVPLAEQEEYRAVFRFRIDEKPAQTNAADDRFSGVSGAFGSGNAGTGTLGQDGLTDQSGTGTPGQDGMPDQGESGAPGQDAYETSGQGEVEADSTETTEDPEAVEAGAQVELPDSGTEASEPEAPEGKRRQVYQADDGMYEVVLENGFTFRSGVPEFMITTQPVKLELEEGSDCKIYRGEEEIETEGVKALDLYGTYRLVSGEYEFAFEISNGYTNQDAFRSPVGTKITEARFQDTVMEVTDSSLLPMEEDGKYAITMAGDGGERLTVILTRDTVAPEVSVNLQRQQAEISYLAQDIAEITLSKDGKAPEAFRGTIITSPGRYTLTVTDRAGNATESEFRLRFHLNFYALAAILLVIAGIAAVAVLLFRKKKNLTVR